MIIILIFVIILITYYKSNNDDEYDIDNNTSQLFDKDNNDINSYMMIIYMFLPTKNSINHTELTFAFG
jgi:hypothetical protein